MKQSLIGKYIITEIEINDNKMTGTVFLDDGDESEFIAIKESV